MEHVTNSPEETEALGEALARRLEPGTVIAFTGDLGAGKTAFVRGLARGLGVRERVTSPTFTIVNEYEGGDFPFSTLTCTAWAVPTSSLTSAGRTTWTGEACVQWSGAKMSPRRWGRTVSGWTSAGVRRMSNGSSP